MFEDTTTQCTIRSSSPQVSVFGNATTIEQYEGYEIVEDTSDDETPTDKRDQAYEIMEDSSGSEVTVKDPSSMTKRKSELIKNDQTTVVNTAHDPGLLSIEASQALREQLDALPEDSFEDLPPTTSPQACLPVPSINVCTVANNTVSSSAQIQTPRRDEDTNPVGSTSLDQPSKAKSTPVSTSRNQRSTKSVNFISVKTADVSPSTAIADGRVLPTLEDENPIDFAKHNTLNVATVEDPTMTKDSIQSSAKSQKQPKSIIKVATNAANIGGPTKTKDSIQSSAKAQKKPKSINKVGATTTNAANVEDLTKTRDSNPSSAKGQKQPKSINKDASTTTNDFVLYRSKVQIPVKTAKPGCSSTTHANPSTTTKVRVLSSVEDQGLSIGSNLGFLNAANLALLSHSVNRDSSTTATQKKTRRDPTVLKPDISALEYMQEVWEAASSAPTSVMSERTKAAFLGFKSGVAWQDKSLNFLEEYAKAGKASAVRFLLSQGCNPGMQENVRRGPLYWAIKGGSQRHNKCVAALLAAGADVHAGFSGGKTVLHLAIEHEEFHGYTNLIRDLLEAGANPNLKNKNGDYPLLQILYGGYKPLEKHRRDALACLLQADFATNVNIMPPGTLNMPLHLAVRRKDPWAVSMLLTRDALVNEPNGSGLTPLMLAANAWTNKSTRNKTEVLKILLRHKANVNERSGEHQRSALHLATLCGYVKAVLFLLQEGADRSIRDVNGCTPIQYAGDNSNIAKMGTKTHGEIMSLLFEALGSASMPAVKNKCAVVTTVLKGMTEEAKILLKHGASPNHIIKSKQRSPLLHLALRANNVDIVRLLIDAGAFVDAKDESGMDAFRVCAASEGRVSAKASFRYMQQKGRRQVVADAKDESGMDAF